ncbi:TetR family transcriptional regulator [Pseudoduganella flava]|uniref:TetR family transcriptional regulator n=1 Tax=Pseudoduganella flava TaxID=871742 RepID=A0A562PKZ1_9BURK|nr:TetR/AcrR family transcriptional regulator [Pseudoduganella flava]QGZ42328.1 TetR family transcriptional regulator [Pseudoduganella flava]TWI44880.1 TetR family transcriptional regulator [Pseudoduganella flava]
MEVLPTSSKRARGRPARPEHEMRDAAIAAAMSLLLQNGYAGLTMEAVAKQAGLAKKTLYRYAANREDLLGLVLRHWTDSFAPLLAQDVAEPADVRPALVTILRSIAAQVLTAEAVGLFRLLGSEFPGRSELLAVYQRNGMNRSLSMFTEWMERHAAAGLLRVDDAPQVCSLLLAMVIGEPLRQMSLGLLPPVPEWNPAPRIDAALRLALGQSLVV